MEEDLGPTKTRTPSQRLRWMLYRIWEKQFNTGKTDKTSEEFYQDYIDRTIENLRKYL
jgi:hypothetical protein